MRHHKRKRSNSNWFSSHSILRANAFSANGDERSDETDTSKSGGTPETSRILLREAVALLDVDLFSNGRGDGERNSRANLEGSVKHSTTQTLDVHWNTSQDNSGGGNEDERHGGYTDERTGKDVDPAICLLALFI